MRNYLALLGWSFDDHTTVMSTQELVERFTLDRVNSSPAVFDAQKLEWLNGEHLRARPPDAYADAVLAHLRRRGSPIADDEERVREVAPLVQEKLRELDGFEAFAGFLFGSPEVDPEAWSRVADDPDAPQALEAARARLEAVDEWDAEAIEAALRAACEDTGMKPRVLFTPVRVAISGRTVAPGLFESLAVLGRDESLARIVTAERNLAAGSQL
jgi:glutamyl-tRNA synthetase